MPKTEFVILLKRPLQGMLKVYPDAQDPNPPVGRRYDIGKDLRGGWGGVEVRRYSNPQPL